MQHTEAVAPHQRYHIPNLKRGLEVFEVLAKNTDGISLSEISRITGYSKNSIFRIICTLEDCGYVVKNKDQRKIRMSRKLAALGYAAFGESNIVDGVMKEDFVVSFSGHTFDCVDKGFAKGEPVDVVIRPEDVDVVPVEKGMLSGKVFSVTFKGDYYEIIVDVAGFKWMLETSDYVGEGQVIGLRIEPDAIHVMKRSKFSDTFGDYSTFSEEMEHLSDVTGEDEQE